MLRQKNKITTEIFKYFSPWRHWDWTQVPTVYFKIGNKRRTQWHMPIIEALERWRQECLELEASLNHIVSLRPAWVPCGLIATKQTERIWSNIKLNEKNEAFFMLSIRMSAMLFSRYHHIFEIFHKLNMFWSSLLTHTGYWAMGRSRSLIGYVSSEAVEKKKTGVVLPKGGPGCSLAEASYLRTLWFGYGVWCVCVGPSSASHRLGVRHRADCFHCQLLPL